MRNKIELTIERLDKLKTVNGGYKVKFAERASEGKTTRLIKGWRRELIGTHVSEELVQDLINIHNLDYTVKDIIDERPLIKKIKKENSAKNEIGSDKTFVTVTNGMINSIDPSLKNEIYPSESITTKRWVELVKDSHQLENNA